MPTSEDSNPDGFLKQFCCGEQSSSIMNVGTTQHSVWHSVSHNWRTVKRASFSCPGRHLQQRLPSRWQMGWRWCFYGNTVKRKRVSFINWPLASERGLRSFLSRPAAGPSLPLLVRGEDCQDHTQLTTAMTDNVFPMNDELALARAQWLVRVLRVVL